MAVLEKEITEHFTSEQLVLFRIAENTIHNRSTTSDDIEKEYNIPASTLNPILKRLELMGFIKTEKEDRIKQYFFVEPKMAVEFVNSMENLRKSYIHTMAYVRSTLRKQK